MATVSSWMIMELLIYGCTPRANTAAMEKAVPFMAPSREKMPPMLFMVWLSASLSMKGTGTTEPSRNTSRANTVKRIFLRSSGIFHAFRMVSITYTTSYFPPAATIFSLAEAEKAEARTISFLVRVPLPSTL